MSNILVIFKTDTFNKGSYNCLSFMSWENSITPSEAINSCLNGTWKNSYIAGNFEQLKLMLEKEVIRRKIKREDLILSPVQIITIPAPFMSISINSENQPVNTICQPINTAELQNLGEIINHLL